MSSLWWAPQNAPVKHVALEILDKKLKTGQSDTHAVYTDNCDVTIMGTTCQWLWIFRVNDYTAWRQTCSDAYPGVLVTPPSVSCHFMQSLVCYIDCLLRIYCGLAGSVVFFPTIFLANPRFEYPVCEDHRYNFREREIRKSDYLNFCVHLLSSAHNSPRIKRAIFWKSTDLLE